VFFIKEKFMNKYFAVILMLCMAVSGIFAENPADNSCEDLCAIIQFTDGQCGVIRELSGNVFLKPAGSSVFTAAKVGDIIAQNTIVSTGFKSTAVIAANNSIITVRPLTQLTFEENINVNLQTGRVKVDTSVAANCTVQSSYATALVRGKNFEFDTVNIKVNEGTAVFSGVSGPAAMVKTGGKSSIGADGKPSDTVLSSLLPAAPAGGAPSSSSKSSGGGGSGGAAGGGGGGGVPSCCQ
jgi:hypothetical protein